MPRCDVKRALPCSQSWRRGSSVGRASCLHPFHPGIKHTLNPDIQHQNVEMPVWHFVVMWHKTYRLSLGSNEVTLSMCVYMFVDSEIVIWKSHICYWPTYRDMQQYCCSRSVEQNPNLTLIWLCFPQGWADQMWWPPLCPERPRGRTDSSGYLREVVCSVQARDELFLSWEWVSRAPGTCKQTKTINTSTRPSQSRV